MIKKIKEAVELGKARVKLSRTPITDNSLIDFQFEKEDNSFIMGDLTIYKVGIEYHYKSPNGNFKQITNAQQVSNLVYGKTQYYR